MYARLDGPRVMRSTAALAAVLTTAASMSACGKQHAAKANVATANGPSAAQPTACPARLRARVLPVWARAGFSDPRPRMPYVLGAKGTIAAIVWADPLVSPPARDYNNKILWVSHAPLRPLDDLRISAQRVRGARRIGSPVSRSVTGGPGPSTIDLPAAGCWHLTLRWSGHTDTMNLRYSPGARA